MKLSRFLHSSRIHIRLLCCFRDDIDCLDDRIFRLDHGRVDAILDNFHAFSSEFHVCVAGAAGVRRVEQRRVRVVGREFHRAIARVGHVTVRTSDSCLEVRTIGGVHLKLGVLHLQHRRLAHLVRPILETCFGVVFFDILDARALCPGEGQVFSIALEVILYVAVGAHHRSHLLARECAPVLALRRERFIQCGVRDDQAHGICFVAVGAADGFGDVRRHLGESHLVIFRHAHLCPQRGIVGRFTGVAGGRGLIRYAHGAPYIH